jgi:hypothetical protein
MLFFVEASTLPPSMHRNHTNMEGPMQNYQLQTNVESGDNPNGSPLCSYGIFLGSPFRGKYHDFM